MDAVVARFHDLAERWRDDGDAAACEALAADLAARLAAVPSPRAVARISGDEVARHLELRPLLRSYGVDLIVEGDAVRFLLLARGWVAPPFPPSVVRRRSIAPEAARGAPSPPLRVTLLPQPDGSDAAAAADPDPDDGAWQPAGTEAVRLLRRLTGRTRLG